MVGSRFLGGVSALALVAFGAPWSTAQADESDLPRSGASLGVPGARVLRAREPGPVDLTVPPPLRDWRAVRAQQQDSSPDPAAAPRGRSAAWRADPGLIDPPVRDPQARDPQARDPLARDPLPRDLRSPAGMGTDAEAPRPAAAVPARSDTAVRTVEPLIKLPPKLAHAGGPRVAAAGEAGVGPQGVGPGVGPGAGLGVGPRMKARIPIETLMAELAAPDRPLHLHRDGTHGRAILAGGPTRSDFGLVQLGELISVNRPARPDPSGRAAASGPAGAAGLREAGADDSGDSLRRPLRMPPPEQLATLPPPRPAFGAGEAPRRAVAGGAAAPAAGAEAVVADAQRGTASDAPAARGAGTQPGAPGGAAEPRPAVAVPMARFHPASGGGRHARVEVVALAAPGPAGTSGQPLLVAAVATTGSAPAAGGTPAAAGTPAARPEAPPRLGPKHAPAAAAPPGSAGTPAPAAQPSSDPAAQPSSGPPAQPSSGALAASTRRLPAVSVDQAVLAALGPPAQSAPLARVPALPPAPALAPAAPRGTSGERMAEARPRPVPPSPALAVPAPSRAPAASRPVQVDETGGKRAVLRLAAAPPPGARPAAAPRPPGAAEPRPPGAAEPAAAGPAERPGTANVAAAAGPPLRLQARAPVPVPGVPVPGRDLDSVVLAAHGAIPADQPRMASSAELLAAVAEARVRQSGTGVAEADRSVRFGAQAWSDLSDASTRGGREQQGGPPVVRGSRAEAFLTRFPGVDGPAADTVQTAQGTPLLRFAAPRPPAAAASGAGGPGPSGSGTDSGGGAARGVPLRIAQAGHAPALAHVSTGANRPPEHRPNAEPPPRVSARQKTDVTAPGASARPNARPLEGLDGREQQADPLMVASRPAHILLAEAVRRLLGEEPDAQLAGQPAEPTAVALEHRAADDAQAAAPAAGAARRAAVEVAALPRTAEPSPQGAPEPPAPEPRVLLAAAGRTPEAARRARGSEPAPHLGQAGSNPDPGSSPSSAAPAPAAASAAEPEPAAAPAGAAAEPVEGGVGEERPLRLPPGPRLPGAELRDAAVRMAPSPSAVARLQAGASLTASAAGRAGEPAVGPLRAAPAAGRGGALALVLPFDAESAALPLAGQADLQRVLALVDQAPGRRILLVGSAAPQRRAPRGPLGPELESDASLERGRRLGYARAVEVRRALVGLGVDPARIRVEGRPGGSDAPDRVELRVG